MGEKRKGPKSIKEGGMVRFNRTAGEKKKDWGLIKKNLARRGER